MLVIDYLNRHGFFFVRRKFDFFLEVEGVNEYLPASSVLRCWVFASKVNLKIQKDLRELCRRIMEAKTNQAQVQENLLKWDDICLLTDEQLNCIKMLYKHNQYSFDDFDDLLTSTSLDEIKSDKSATDNAHGDELSERAISVDKVNVFLSPPPSVHFRTESCSRIDPLHFFPFLITLACLHLVFHSSRSTKTSMKSCTTSKSATSRMSSSKTTLIC